MTDSPEVAYFERRLQQEIEEIEARIRELMQEKFALQRQLTKARRESSGLADVHRKNSINRAMIENRILDALAGQKKAASFKTLLTVARFVDHQLKEGTLRTTLHRMKNKGLIKPGKIRGTWQLPQSSPTE